MSAHTPCTCPGTRKERMKNWQVVVYKANYSAFNGYAYTPSDYSQVCCTGTGCNGAWRTKAPYVNELTKAPGCR